MNISKITLDEMLSARERRAEKQRALTERFARPIVCFTMNIAGEVKRTPLTELVFFEGVRRIEDAMPPALFREVWREKTGCEAFFVFDESAEETKRRMVAIEEADAAARLFDIDVINMDGEKLSRGAERRCIVCGAPVTGCARSRAHGLSEIVRSTDALLCSFAAKHLAGLACGALTAEVEATPKPGLVDRNNNGAHRDMDLALFYRSAAALKPHFARMAALALEQYEAAPETLMAALRTEGLLAERAMFAATGGVNTHKGAIFSMGLLLAGKALALRRGGEAASHAAALAQSDMEAELRRAGTCPETNGERIYARYAVRGARGEAAEGFPAARAAAERYAAYRKDGKSENDALALTLPHIMAGLSDTNLLHRGGEEGLCFAQEQARAVLALPEAERLAALAALDAEFIRRNLSPGGSADMLALAALLYALEETAQDVVK
ncbi:citrate lyase holo-[acyl-carrier protein] synthase [bacterium]|nr:citrate lyase holo-[acyl-carrier protein] synthase [bacterium]